MITLQFFVNFIFLAIFKPAMAHGRTFYRQLRKSEILAIAQLEGGKIFFNQFLVSLSAVDIIRAFFPCMLLVQRCSCLVYKNHELFSWRWRAAGQLESSEKKIFKKLTNIYFKVLLGKATKEKFEISVPSFWTGKMIFWII